MDVSRRIISLLKRCRSFQALISQVGHGVTTRRGTPQHPSVYTTHATSQEYCTTHASIIPVMALVTTMFVTGSAAAAEEAEGSANSDPPPKDTRDYATAKWRIFTDRSRDLVNQKRFDEAEKLLQEAVVLAERGFGDGTPHVASAKQNLAELYRLRKEYGKAAPLYEDAIKILTENYGTKDIRVAFALHNIAGFYLAQYELEKAAHYYEQALQVKLAAVGPGHTETSNTLFHLAEVRWMQGNVETAIRLAKQSLDIARAQASSMGIAYSKRQQRLADMLVSAERHIEAQDVLKELLTSLSPEDTRTKATTLESLSGVLQSLHKYEDARALLEQTLAIREQQKPHFPISYAASLRRLAELEIHICTNSNDYIQQESKKRDACLRKAYTAAEEAVKSARSAVAMALSSSELREEKSMLSTLKELISGPTVKIPTIIRTDLAVLGLAQALILQSHVCRLMHPTTDLSISKSLLEEARTLLFSSNVWKDPPAEQISPTIYQTLHKAERQRIHVIKALLTEELALCESTTNENQGTPTSSSGNVASMRDTKCDTIRSLLDHYTNCCPS